MRDTLGRAILTLSLSLNGCAQMWGTARAAPASAAPEPPLLGEEGATSVRPGAPGTPPAPAAPATPEMRAITGEVTAVTADVAGLVSAIRVHAAEVGGTIAREDLRGDAQHRLASTVLRLPPAAVTAFFDWLGARAALENRHYENEEVTRQYFDRELAMRNLGVTMERLEDLVRRPEGELKDVLEIEREITRVRGELERLRGEQRLLADQVARATLTVRIAMDPDVHAEPALKFELVPHLAYLHLADAGPRAADRTGGGVTLIFGRAASLDLQVFPRRDGDARSYLFTFGGRSYSDYLGGGQRRVGNPYLGLRIGGARMNDLGAFAYGVDAGVELLRARHFLVEISGRAIGLWYNRDSAPRGDLLLEATVGVGVPW